MSYPSSDELNNHLKHKRPQKYSKPFMEDQNNQLNQSILQKAHSLNKTNAPFEQVNNPSDDSIINFGNVDIRQGDRKRQQWIQDFIPNKGKCSSRVDISDIGSEQMKGKMFDRSFELSRIIAKNNQSNYENNSTINFTQQDQNDPLATRQLKTFNQITETNELNSSQLKMNTLKKGTIKSNKQTLYMLNSSFKKKRNQIKRSKTEESPLDQNQNGDLCKSEEQSRFKVKREPHEVWLSGFFNILYFVNKFMYQSKLKLIHFKPGELQDNQLQAINDLDKITVLNSLFFYQIPQLLHFLKKASNYQSEKDQKLKSSEKIFKRSHRLIRKMRIYYLLTRKKLKLCIIPFNQFFYRLQKLFQKILDPLPVILPYYKLSLFWDLVSISFTLINVFSIPFEIAFLNGDRLNQNLSYASQVIFFINFIMILNTAYYENGIIQKDRIKILLNFVNKHFIIEFLAYICLFYNPFGVPFLRIFFLIKFFSFYETIQKLIESFQLSDKYYYLVHLITLLLEIIFLCHLFSCLWYGIGQYQQEHNMTPNWISFYSIDKLSLGSQYIQSIYFSIVTVGTIGYGDINAKSDLEKVFISTLTLFSCGVFAYIISNIQDVYKEYNKKQEEFLLNLSDLNRYMYTRDVNPNLQQMARKYLKYVYEQDYKRGDVPNQTLNFLSKFLREEITQEVFIRSIKNIKIFQNFSPQFQKAIAIKMKEITYGPDEMILKIGQYQPPALYFIFKGRVEVSLENANTLSSQFNNHQQRNPFYLIQEKSVFGQYEFMSQTHESLINAKSLNVTTIHQLTLSDFMEVINQFIIDKEKYLELKDKLNNYQNYQSINVFCYSCKSSQHLIHECPIFFYKPNNQRVINQFIQVEEVARNSIKRSSGRLVLNSLTFQKEIEDECKYFREQNVSELGCDVINVSHNDKLIDQDNDNYYKIKFLSIQNSNNNRHNDSEEIFLNKKKMNSEGTINQEQIRDFCFSNLEEIEKYKIDNSINKQQTSPPSHSTKSISINQGYDMNNGELNTFEYSLAKQSQQQALTLSQQLPQRKSLKQEFTKKATLKSARTKRLMEFDKKMEDKLDELREQRQNSRHTQLEVTQKKSRFKNNMAISIVQSVLEQMQNTNARTVKIQQNEQPEDLVTETIKSFRFYMTHNNIAPIIKSFNKFLSKESIKKKRKFSIFKQLLQK